MKSLIELFKIVKKHKSLLSTGLCGLVKQLHYKTIITTEETERLLNYIRNNRPKKGSRYYYRIYRHFACYWTIGEWNPRRNWINAQIRLLKKEREQEHFEKDAKYIIDNSKFGRF